MQLGKTLEVIHAELLPEDKAKIIKEFRREGPTAMVGDGINDAPALATADIGISMGISGSALATETGHVILLSNDIRKIPKAIRLSRRTNQKVVQNVILSITTKCAILGLALAGHPLVWAAVLADVGTCLLVIFNSMLLLRDTHKHKGKCCKSTSAPHSHKHGCGDSHSHLSDKKHQHCCSNDKAPKVCKPQKCCSSHTKLSKCQASDDKCMDSAKMHDDCGDDNVSHKGNHCHHGSSNMCNHDLESQNTHDHNCAEGDSVKIGGQGDFVQGEGLHITNKCENGKVTNKTGHCHSSHCGKNHKNNKEAGKTDEPSCAHQHQNLDSCQKKCGGHHTAIDKIHGSEYNDHVEHIATHACEHSAKKDLDGCCESSRSECTESAAKNACMSLEKRETNGCCKSYMKECCSKHAHLGAAFGGATLSEIITE